MALRDSGGPHHHRLAQFVFILLLVFVEGLLLCFVGDYLIFKTGHVFSLKYMVSILAPNFILIMVVHNLLPGRRFQLLMVSRIEHISPLKRMLVLVGIILIFMSTGLLYIAYVPSSGIVVLQTGICILAIMEFIVLFRPKADLSGPITTAATVVLSIVLMEFAAPLLISVAASALMKAGTDNDAIANLDYGDVHQEPKDTLFREGGKLVPNLDVMVVGEARNQSVRFITNSKGFRNDHEFPYFPLPDTYRILYLGDSFVAGYRVGQESTSGKVIEKELTWLIQEGGGYLRPEVLIASLSEPTTAWFWLEEYGFEYHPDLVILGLTIGNDIFQAYLATDPDGYLTVVDAGDSMSIGDYREPKIGFTTSPVRDLYLPPDAFLLQLNSPELYEFLPHVGYSLKAKYLWSNLGALFSRALNPSVAIDSWYLDTEPGRIHLFDIANGLGMFYRPEIKQVTLGYERLEIVLRGMKKRCDEQRSDLLVVFFPQRFQVTDEEWRQTSLHYMLDPEHFDLESPSRRLMIICERNEINCFDLLPFFRNETALRTGALYLPSGDMHWNENGHRLAGTYIAKFIWEHYDGSRQSTASAVPDRYP